MIMTPEMLGIVCPKELKHMYGDDAVSPGDGDPVVTEYPQYPMSAWELWAYMKGKHPKHCKDLQTKYPAYFDSHSKNALSRFLNGRKVVKASGYF